ncbi:phage tail tape measure protein, partial [Brucella rhizosphaerae]|uniref:phage tail tape measure protein n=1 Tax=Brucella rhizosphaerae TaxID=571254 RepID=UPI000465876E
LLAIGAGYVGVREGIGGTVGAAMKFEEAFADVRKVVDGTPAQLSVLKSEILEMSKVIPTSAEGIAEIVAAAGQSNIPYQELGKFTEMVAKVAVAWDTSERETSESLAKIKTQLNFSTDQIGLYADAINHLSNNTAATAPNLVDFAKRVAAQGDMFGFTATQSLAFGGAMIAAGGETEVAATSFRNMGMALADAAKAPKRTQAAFKDIGVNSQKIGKAFNKNSVGTMLDVFERINKLPEHQRLSAAIGIFGREARALMPLINDTRELRRQLGLVATEADYSGSAFQEFVIRADTTGNVLDLLGNKLRARGIKYGESWLPTLKEFSLGVSDVVDTLDKRVGVIDNIQMAVNGLMSGFGYGGTGGMREMINDLGDILFGEAFKGDGTQVDQRMTDLAKLSNNFRKIGLDLKAFAKDIGAGDIMGAVGHVSDAISKMSGTTTVISAIGIAAVGAAMITMGRGITRLAFSPFGTIGLVAAAIVPLINAAKGSESLGEFADNLTKLSLVDWALIGGGLLAISRPLANVVKTIRKIPGLPKSKPSSHGGSKPRNPAPPKSSNTKPWGSSETSRSSSRPTGPNGGKPSLLGPKPWSFSWSNLGGAGKGLLIDALLTGMGQWAINKGLGTVNDQLYTSGEQRRASAFRNNVPGIFDGPSFFDNPFGKPKSFKEAMAIETKAGTSGPADVLLVGTPPVTVATPVTTVPSGTQEVRVTNPQPAPVINITVNATTNASPQEIANQAMGVFASQYRAATGGAYSDGGM